MARFADVVLPATIYPPEAGSAAVPPFTCSLTFRAVVPIPTWFVVDSTNKAPALTFTSPPSLFNKSVLETPLLRAMISFSSITTFDEPMEPATIYPPPANEASDPPTTFSFTEGTEVPIPTLPATYKPFAGGVVLAPTATPPPLFTYNLVKPLICTRKASLPASPLI